MSPSSGMPVRQVTTSLITTAWFGTNGWGTRGPGERGSTGAWAKVGWLRTKQLGFRSRQFVFHEFDVKQPAATGDVPAFHLERLQPGEITKLPAPTAAFALSLSRAEVSDAALKELAGLKR